jgi:hypothetical protein
MSWRGFVVESKSYMSYNGLSPRQKVWFWLYRFPRAWLRFQLFGLRSRALDAAYAVRNFVVRLFTPRQ